MQTSWPGMECRPGAMYHPPKLLRRVFEGPSSATTSMAFRPAVRAPEQVNGARQSLDSGN
jgi:hypothetical protein